MAAPPAPGAVTPTSRRRVVAALVGVFGIWALGLGSGCPETPPSQPSRNAIPGQPPAVLDLAGSDGTAAKPQFIDVTFVELYQLFMSHGLSNAEKAQRWSRQYRGRWIRWTGQLAYIRTSTLLFRQLGSSTTQDIFLFAPEQRRENPPLTPGRFYNYVGRLTRYDDMFRTFYLDQGMVLGPDEVGVPGNLAESPALTRRLPGPPSPLPWPPLPAPGPTKPELAPSDGGAVPSPP